MINWKKQFSEKFKSWFLIASAKTDYTVYEECIKFITKLLIDQRVQSHKEFRGELMDMQRSKNKVLKFNIELLYKRHADELTEILKDWDKYKDSGLLCISIANLIGEWREK